MHDWQDQVLRRADAVATISRIVAGRLRHLPVSQPGMRAMVALYRDSQLTDREIGQRTGMSSAQVSHVMKRLVADGMIEFSASPKHKSQRLLYLTVEGSKLACAIDEARKSGFEEALAPMEPGDRSAIRLLGMGEPSRATIISQTTMREAKLQDILAALGLLPQLDKGFQQQAVLGHVMEVFSALLRRFYADEGLGGYVHIDSEDRVIGYAFTMNGSSLDDNNSDEGDMIVVGPFVTPRYRRKGLARDLLEACLGVARDNSFNTVNALAAKADKGTIGLLRHLGYIAGASIGGTSDDFQTNWQTFSRPVAPRNPLLRMR